METIFNLGNKKETISSLERFRNNKYENRMIEIVNAHLKRINKFYGNNIFSKNDCFIDSQTLWEIMQPIGFVQHHHSHGLSPEQIFDVLTEMKKPFKVVKSYDSRYVIITLKTEDNGYNLCVVIKPNTYIEYLDKKINKIITIHPIEIKM